MKDAVVFMVATLVLLYAILQLITWGDGHLVLRDPNHAYPIRIAAFHLVAAHLWWRMFIGLPGTTVCQLGRSQWRFVWFGVTLGVASVLVVALSGRSTIEIAGYLVGAASGCFNGWLLVKRDFD